ncbi:MAG: family 20 glycosylhydrolase [Terracidiphilus sp.]|nr:family 20 glycosylhydrolase [Terracidiphilus sp.]
MTQRWFRSALILPFVCATLLLPPASFAQEQSSLDLMPQPAHLTQGEGRFLIDGSFTVELSGYKDARVEQGRQRFLATLGRETGIPFAAVSAAGKASFLITTAGPGEAVQRLGEDESYRLVITTSKVELSAANPLGVLHGLQTFLQLVRITPQGFAVPVVSIDDQPRFPWRGLMIDVGRHFMPIPVIERNLDGMEATKLNVLHWHLSDDQGFRVESKQAPLLQEKGSAGNYYTQAQIRGVIEYARARGIRVVPEFDMPCHTSSWLVGYPQLGSGPGPYELPTKWGVLDAAMDPTRETTYEFLDKFLGEMTALFPDAYFHVGGDECDGKEWDANPRIQAFMKAHSMKDDAALQSYFSGRVQKLVAGHHKIMMGWDEVLQPDTPRDVVIHSWRGPTALAAAARQGNRVLLSNGYYIDLNQPASDHYLVDPLGGDGASLSAEEKARVLGGEATMWSELVTPENIDSRIWPRTAAIAERLWSAQDVRDVDSMYRRLAVVSQKLEHYGLEHNSSTVPMLRRMSGELDPRGLEVLATAVQPPEGYEREGLHDYTTLSPLNRLVDAVPPESELARQFSLLAGLIAAGKATPEEWQKAQDWLQRWRDNDAKLQPRLAGSQLTAELIPLSHSLAQVADLGLQALDDLKNHRTVSAEAREKNLELLKAAAKPQAVLVDKLVAPVELLVRASGTP